jgi:hypothetical protein
MAEEQHFPWLHSPGRTLGLCRAGGCSQKSTIAVQALAYETTGSKRKPGGRNRSKSIALCEAHAAELYTQLLAHFPGS